MRGGQERLSNGVNACSPSDASSSTLVRLSACSKTYRRGPEIVKALTDVSFAVEGRELVALVGPSGSGKTTLLNLIAGWERTDSGTIEWRAARGQHETPCWSALGVVPQRLGLMEELTIGENISLPIRLLTSAIRGQSWRSGGERESELKKQLVLARRELHALIGALGLTEVIGRLPQEVSLGEQQRAAIARALVLSPPLAILDEPTAHQDEENADRILLVLRGVRDRGNSCLLATHAPSVIEQVDRTTLIQDGRLQRGEP